MVCDETTINAEAIGELLRKLSDRHVGLPMTLVLDNARYQRCAAVQELARSPRIELLFLPPCSPNLNLIERLWKFVKKDCLSCRYHGSPAKSRSTRLPSVAARRRRAATAGPSTSWPAS